MRILLALVLTSCGAAALWASLDRPLDAPDWRGRVRGVSYSPSGLYNQAQLDGPVPEAVIRRDLQQLAQYTNRVRTYTVDRGQDRIPCIARELGLKVSLGIWLGEDRRQNEIELAKGIEVIGLCPGTVDRVFVGNEAVLRHDLSADEVVGYMRRVRQAVADQTIEIGTGEVWSMWLENPQLARGSAFVGIHLLPYWEGVAAHRSMDYVLDRVDTIHKAFPDKKIVIAEAGWPTDGRVKRGSVPSPAMAAYFLRHFLALAQARDYDYYIIEAFDQPWKADTEGAVGAFWGVWDADGQPKFALTGRLTSFERWPLYAAVAVLANVAIGLLVLWLIPEVTMRGYLLVGGIIALVVSGALFIVDATSLRYTDWRTIAAAAYVVPPVLFTALLLITETTEWALSLWRRRRPPVPSSDLVLPPRVSIHVPTHNEPPLMVIQALNALARLDYPNFEVIVLDNNTGDEALWRPVEARCHGLGPHFRFFHFDGIKGFKAGALNKALELTDPSAEFVAIVDSDYQVAPEWLRTAVPVFADPAIAVVQAPQDYRDPGANLFKSLCYEEYSTFFRVGMVERNAHNAIIQHGTMCVIRRSALEAVGRWAEWCITEDTELGLRLLEAGHKAMYVPVSMGRGLMPDTYEAYVRQRYRWVYGAVQIMKRHASPIFVGGSHLTWAQRYHFIAGWLPWISDGLSLVFGVLALGWTALMIAAPKQFDVPLAALSSVALALFTIKTVKTVLLHRAKTESGFVGGVAAALTGLALACTVGRGVLAGIFTSSKPFLRTPKCEDAAPWTHVIRLAGMETVLLIGTILAFAGAGVGGHMDDPAEMVWAAVLLVLAVPYASTFLVGLSSTLRLGRVPLAGAGSLVTSRLGTAHRPTAVDSPAGSPERAA